MATKKIAKKSKTGRTTTRTATRTSTRRAAGQTSTGNLQGQEVFKTSEEREQQVEVPAGHILLFVNGRNKGVVGTNSQHLGAFVKAQAEQAGIRSFSVYVDGVKADTSWSNRSLTSFKKMELVAKDARG